MKNKHHSLASLFTWAALSFAFLNLVDFHSDLFGQSGEIAKLKTVAEKSGFTATCLHQELLDFQNELAKAEHVTNVDVGRTVNGRLMQTTVIAQPAYKFGDRNDERLVVLLLGNIHSGECAGKEGLLMLLRDLAVNAEHPWLKNLVIVCLPNYNADGNDRIGRNEIHRPGQMGPSAGMGLRENAQQLDLNRDFMKVESPEARALVQLIDTIDPHLFIDCHTTNGSRHRYQLTYDIPHNPTAPQLLRDFMRNQMMPQITENLEKEKNISTFYYGNFSRDLTRWTTYGHEPRYSTEYVGLRGRLSVLSEAYSYISYKDRIVASKEFVTACVNFVHENGETVKKLLAKIERNAQTESAQLSLAAEVQPFDRTFKLKGYDGNSDTPKDHEVEFYGNYVSSNLKTIPGGYILDQKYGRIIDRLLMHGIDVHQFTSSAKVKAKAFEIDKVDRAARAFQNHKMVKLNGKWSEAEIEVASGSYFVPTRQPLGRLAAYLLEPESNDGLVTWNFFDSTIDTQSTFPVYSYQGNLERLKLKQIQEVAPKRQLSIEELYGLKGKINFGGNANPELKWVSNSQYRTTWNGRPVLVDAETGFLDRLPFVSPRMIQSKLVNSAKLPNELASQVAQGDQVEVEDGLVINALGDLFWVSISSNEAKRLTSDPAKEELVTASPDKKQIAFVKGNDLYRIRLDNNQLIRVTKSGNENILNGKLDWVYQEELYGRGNYKGFWWSPDSQSLAYLTLDQSQVKRYHVTDNIPVRQSHEIYPYPKAGDPNPTVRISIDDQTLDLNTFKVDSPLISQVCWGRDGKVYFQLQNRIQNEMNLVSWQPGHQAQVLVQESVKKGWIDSPGNPIWIDGLDGFLWFTHRGGRRHIASYSSNGKILEPGTGLTHPKNDAIEVRELVGASKDVVYFLAANPNDVTRMQLYQLDQSGKSKMITDAKLNHSAIASPDLKYFFDFQSDINTPTQVALRTMDGTFVRFVEPNLVDHLDYYELVAPVFQRVPTRDGDQLDSMLILPPDFDESKKYPVLMHVYSGPQAPRVRNRWSGTSYLWHQMMAQKGYVIWMCDNRSATHHGMNVSYPIYGDLGRRELMDIEDSLTWLKKKNWVDSERIGIWGWSYGGYMTAYAMTHSDSFKVGISGAPVTDWRNYDSIYTERYMGLPAFNKKGYDDSSVVKAASNLSGKILIIHGTQDDNVHISNTYQFVNALQNACKQFDLMIYPKNRHGIRIPSQTKHLRELMTRFILDNL